MIKRNQQLLNAINVMSDMALLLLSQFLAWAIRFRIMEGTMTKELALSEYVTIIILFSLFTVLVYAFAGRYKSHRFREPTRDIPIVIGLNAGCSIVFMAFVFLIHIHNFSRGSILIYWILSSILVSVKRLGMSVVLRHYRSLGFNLRHIVLVGTGKIAEQYFEDIKAAKYLGIYIDGFVGDEGTAVGDLPRLCGYGELSDWLDRHDPDEIVIAVEYAQMDRISEVIAASDHSGVRTSMIPFYSNLIPANPVIEVVGDSKLIDLNATPMDNPGAAFVKRAADIVGGCILTAVFSPVMLVTAIGVKLSSPGPVLFRQERVGKNKKTFYMLKFRSMRVTAEQNTAWTTDEDPRKTRFGSFIRKYSIDELPQFINVIKGEMSLVGPRPEIPYHVKHFREEIPLYMVRSQVRPGITGWAQIHGLRGNTSIEDRIKLDIEYIETWSLWLDLQILVRTLFGGWINNEKLASKSGAKQDDAKKD